MAEPESVLYELTRVDLQAYKLYRICRDSRLKTFADDLISLLETLDEVQTQAKSSIISGPDREPERRKALILFQDTEKVLRRLDRHLREILGPRNRPPPDLRDSHEIQDGLIRSRKALLRWAVDLLNAVDREPIKTLPYRSPPTQSKKTPSSSENSSPAVRHSPTSRPVQNLYRRAVSYGGVPLNSSLKPETLSSSDESGSRKQPPSPYQPTIEDVPDDGIREENPSHSNVESYHMTPPSSASESVEVRSSHAAQAASASLNREYQVRETHGAALRPRQESTSKPKRPSFHEHRSWEASGSLLSPQDAVRRASGQTLPHSNAWTRPQEDFPLYSDAEDELDDNRSASQTLYKVETVSAQSTPKEGGSDSSSYQRRTSFARSPLRPDARSDSRVANHSPLFSSSGGPSPRRRLMGYGGDAQYGMDEYLSRPFPRDTVATTPTPRRPRASTSTTPGQPAAHRYSMYAGSLDAVHQAAGNEILTPDAKDFYASFAPGKADSFERQFHTTEKPKPATANRADTPPPADQSSAAHNSPKAAPVKEYKLAFTLEEFYRGTTRKMKITDKASPSTYRMLEVPLAPGLRPGSTVKFSNVELGSSGANASTGELHFVIEEKPHSIFRRHGDDLHAILDIPLVDSLCGWERILRAICGTDVRVRSFEPTPPGWKECYAGLGMPKRRAGNGERGDLYITINVVYPSTLSEEKRQLLREIMKN